MRVFDLRVFLYILYYIHSYNNQLTYIIIFSKSKTSYLPSVSLLLCLLGTQALTIFHFRVPTFASTSLYFSKSKSHPAQVIIIRTSHDPISQLLHTITAPLRYPLLSTINLPSNNTGLCTVRTYNNQQNHLLLSCILSETAYTPFTTHI